jgi:hypothetical protein
MYCCVYFIVLRRTEGDKEGRQAAQCYSETVEPAWGLFCWHSPLHTRAIRCLSFPFKETYLPRRLFLDLDQLMYRFEKDLEVPVVFLFEFCRLPRSIFLAWDHDPQFSKGSHELDINLNCARTVQNARTHRDTVFSKSHDILWKLQGLRDASEDITNRNILFTVLYLYYSHLLKRGGSKNGFLLYLTKNISRPKLQFILFQVVW